MRPLRVDFLFPRGFSSAYAYVVMDVVNDSLLSSLRDASISSRLNLVSNPSKELLVSIGEVGDQFSEDELRGATDRLSRDIDSHNQGAFKELGVPGIRCYLRVGTKGLMAHIESMKAFCPPNQMEQAEMVTTKCGPCTCTEPLPPEDCNPPE